MLIRLTEVDVYDEEEINISELSTGDPGAWNQLLKRLCVFYFLDGILRLTIRLIPRALWGALIFPLWLFCSMSGECLEGICGIKSPY